MNILLLLINGFKYLAGTAICLAMVWSVIHEMAIPDPSRKGTMYILDLLARLGACLAAIGIFWHPFERVDTLAILFSVGIGFIAICWIAMVISLKREK